jgi:hypothetical protein
VGARYAELRLGYLVTMASHPHQPGSDEADREKDTTPGGVARDLEERAEEVGASTGPAPTSGLDEGDPEEPDRG